MKNHEILAWLIKIKPENETQKKAIQAMERVFREITEDDLDESLKDFFELYTREEIINKPSSELYEEYLNNCSDFDYTEVSQSAFSRIVKNYYNVKIKITTINKKSVRVYR